MYVCLLLFRAITTERIIHQNNTRDTLYPEIPAGTDTTRVTPRGAASFNLKPQTLTT